MHVVIAVMVIAVTFFTAAWVVMFVIVVIRPFHEQRFHACKLGNRHLFCSECFADFSINASISGPIQTTKSAFCKRFTSEGRRE
jgi:hypothetical protein